MRKETILDIALRLMKENRNDWREVIGTTVLTEYTNKTYFVDDVDFNMSPLSKFTPAHEDFEVTYEAYYIKKYNLIITDKYQFLLVSNARERDLRAGQNEHIYLLPELCRATGMTEAMRKDFKLMQDLSKYTRLSPADRVKALKKFNNRIQSTPESVQVLEEWKMELSKELVTVPGREFPAETVCFGDSNETPANDKGEWMFKNGTKMFQSVPVTKWLVLYPQPLDADVRKFMIVLRRAFDEMQVQVTDPMM